MDAAALEFLRRLIDAPSPSGFEIRAQECVRRRMQSVSKDVETDLHGNVIGRLNRGGPLRIMLAGHCDEIGLMVSHISDEGFLFIQPVGGIDLSLLPGHRVHVHAEKGRVIGVIGKKPVHLMTPEDRKRVVKAHELWVDIGARNRKEALRRVEVGDIITVALGLELMQNNLAVARAFDDKIGAFVITEAFCRLSRVKSLPIELAAVSTVQEEVGLRGARTSAFGIEPHVGIAVDVGFASDYPGAEKKIVGDLQLGKGPILPRGPTINPVVGRLLIDTARKRNIPFQLAAEPRASGTDANAIQITRAGVAAGLVSIPNRYMHTPAEVVSLRDTEHTIRLLVEFVKSVKPGTDFTPRP